MKRTYEVAEQGGGRQPSPAMPSGRHHPREPLAGGKLRRPRAQGRSDVPKA